MADNYITADTEKGRINISDDVIAVMVAAAISEVEGVAGLSNTVGSELIELIGKRSVSKGVKVSIEGENIVVDVLIMVTFGCAVTEVAKKVQKSVVAALESMIGMTPRVNVHVSGVSFRAASKQ